MTVSNEARAILAFWQAAGHERWFGHDAAFDADIAQRFGALHVAAVGETLPDWEDTPEGALALVILLDQFSRNLNRGTAAAFASDVRAREIADRAIACGFDAHVAPGLRTFFYLPFMHSETLADQERCVSLYEALGDPDSLKYARTHRDIIARFGRFPHRNAVLGRAMTDAEQRFLDDGGFKG